MIGLAKGPGTNVQEKVTVADTLRIGTAIVTHTDTAVKATLLMLSQSLNVEMGRLLSPTLLRCHAPCLFLLSYQALSLIYLFVMLTCQNVLLIYQNLLFI